MDERRFDRLARELARSRWTRRGLVGLGLVALAVWRREVVAQSPICQPQNAFCTMWLRCCTGLICNLPLTNPHLGTCQPGTDTLGTGWALIGLPAVPTTAAAQATATPKPTKTPKPTRATRTPKSGNGNGGGKKKNNGKKKRRRNRNNGGGGGSGEPSTLLITLGCTATPETIELTNSGTGYLYLFELEPDPNTVGDVVQFTDGSDLWELAPGEMLLLPLGGQMPLFDPPQLSDTEGRAGILVYFEDEDAAEMLTVKGFCDNRPSVVVDREPL